MHVTTDAEIVEAAREAACGFDMRRHPGQAQRAGREHRQRAAASPSTCRRCRPGARRLRPRRHRGRDVCGDARGRRRLGQRLALRDGGGIGRDRQAGHGDRAPCRIAARVLPHASLVNEEKIAADLDVLDERVKDWRRTWPARRLHQWLL